MINHSPIQSLDKERLLSRDEAANMLGTTSGTLAVWASTGRYTLPFVKIGSLVKYRQSDLTAFIERQTQNKGGQNE
ncbi:MAG: helix-turn-helix domain-containing protein [Alphaproteobacteria bacterium]